MSRFNDIFLQLFCEKNSDNTLNLRLRGRELFARKGFRIEDDDMVKVSTFLKKYAELIVKLDLCYNNIGDNGIKCLTEIYLGKTNILEHLNLIGCNVTSRGMCYLSKARNHLKLRTLRLTGNKLGTEGGQFAAMLLSTPDCSIQYLDLGDCDQTPSSVPFITSMLRSDIGHNTSLEALDMSRIIPAHSVYQFDPAHVAEHMAEALRLNTTLRELHLQRCEFDGHDVDLLLVGLQNNVSLLLLDIGYNNIGNFGIENLAKWLKTNPALQGLNVAGNKIRDSGASALSFGMPFSKIRLLDISQNEIEDEGMIDILHTIKKKCIMRLFFIWGNKLGQDALEYLQWLIKCGTIKLENLDVRVYEVDNQLQCAYYPQNHYKHRYYSVLDKGKPTQLRIRRNIVGYDSARHITGTDLGHPAAKVKFLHYQRVPEIDYSLPLADEC